MIRDRFVAYLSILAGHAPALDVGCGRGRGELLAFSAKGRHTSNSWHRRVDGRKSAIKGFRCGPRGRYRILGAQAGALGAVSSAQVIEHLPPEAVPPEVVQRLLAETYRVLRPGEVMVDGR